MANVLGGMVISIGFNVDNKKLTQLENRLKKIGALWDGITAKKLQGMETAAEKAGKRIEKIEIANQKRTEAATARLLKIQQAAQIKADKSKKLSAERHNRLMRKAFDKDEADKEKKRKDELKEATKRLKATLAAEEKGKADAAKREKDRINEIASLQRRHAMEQKRAFNDLKSGLMGIAAMSATASAGIWAVLNRAGQSGASMRNFLLKSGLDRTRTKDLAYAGAKFGISEEQMFGNVIALQQKMADIQAQGGNTAPFALFGINPDQNPLDVLENMRSRIQRLDPKIAMKYAGEMGINPEMFAFLQSQQRGKMPEAFKLSGEELNNLVRLNMAMNEFLYLLGEFANKVAGKVGDKLAKIIEGMSDFLGVALDVIDTLDKMPVVGKILKAQALIIIGGITGIAIASAMAVLPLAALANAIKVVGSAAALSAGTTAVGNRLPPLPNAVGRLGGFGSLLMKGLGIGTTAYGLNEALDMSERFSSPIVASHLGLFGVPESSALGSHLKSQLTARALLPGGSLIQQIKGMMEYISLGGGSGNGGSTDNSRNVGQVTLNVNSPEDAGVAMNSLMESLGGVPYTMPMPAQ